ncbi:14758_t:CDS:2, partial [Gigaspora rosea]
MYALEDNAKGINTIDAKLEELCPYYSRIDMIYGQDETELKNNIQNQYETELENNSQDQNEAELYN